MKGLYMTDDNKISQPTEKEVWKEAAKKWYDKNILPYLIYDLSGPFDGGPIIGDAAEYAAGIDWNICHYCAGPCGYCPQKYSTDPYRCEPCPQDSCGGATECTYCPIAYINYLLKRLTEESDDEEL